MNWHQYLVLGSWESVLLSPPCLEICDEALVTKEMAEAAIDLPANTSVAR